MIIEDFLSLETPITGVRYPIIPTDRMDTIQAHKAQVQLNKCIGLVGKFGDKSKVNNEKSTDFIKSAIKFQEITGGIWPGSIIHKARQISNSDPT